MSPSIIKNYSQLLPPDLSKPQLLLRKIILNALELGIKSVMPKNLMEQSLKIQNGKFIIQNCKFDLHSYDEIIIIGGGKAVAHMTAYLEKLLSKVPNIKYRGTINVPEGLALDDLNLSASVDINYASHPIPNEAGIKGVQKMIGLIKTSSKNSLVVFLVSGGGSALLPLPRKGIKLADLQAINTLLLESGASIHEINSVRKHLSDLKGGNLARIFSDTNKGKLVSLIISDVVGNNFDSIASGPTVPDSSTFKDVLKVLNKYELFRKVPPSIRSLVEKGLINSSLETPKPGDECFNNVHNFLIGSVESAVETITNFLEAKNFTVEYFSNTITGEARVFGKKIFNDCFIEINAFQVKNNQIALIGTGELTVTIKGNGIGGRNQEMLLSFLKKAKISKVKREFCILSANLDGIEGNSRAMGALVDSKVCEDVLKLNLDIKKYLDRNDSNSAFKILASEIITGPTGCNVNDIMILLYDDNSKRGE